MFYAVPNNVCNVFLNDVLGASFRFFFFSARLSREGRRGSLNLNFIVIIRQFRDERCSCATFPFSQIAVVTGERTWIYRLKCTQMERLSRLIFRWNIESLRLTWGNSGSANSSANISRKAMLYGRLNENKPQLCLKAAFAAWNVDCDYRPSLLQWPESFSITFQFA